MDVTEELALIRQRIDQLERQVSAGEQPGSPSAALVVRRVVAFGNNDVVRWTVYRVIVDEVEGATPEFEAIGNILAPGIGSGTPSPGIYRVAVPVRGGRFAVVV